MVVKERFSKKYRLPELDERLTRERMKSEARAIIKCKTLGIPTPKLFFVDQCFIVMEYLEFPTVRDYIRQLLDHGTSVNEEQRAVLSKLAVKIGHIIGKLHNNSLIHGDMTTSNMLVDAGQGQIYFIDFGLSLTEGTVEDKGVDLYVLERAIISAHPNTEFFFQCILKAYEEELAPKSRESVLKKYQEIRLRGRKRDMVG